MSKIEITHDHLIRLAQCSSGLATPGMATNELHDFDYPGRGHHLGPE